MPSLNASKGIDFSFLAKGIIEEFRPIPALTGYGLNMSIGPWASGAPIPEGAVCMRRLPSSFSTAWWNKRNDPDALRPEVCATLILAALCDHNGELYVPLLPPQPDGTPNLDYSAEQKASIMNYLTWQLGEHIQKCVTDYAGWSTFGKLDAVGVDAAVEHDAKNS